MSSRRALPAPPSAAPVLGAALLVAMAAFPETLGCAGPEEELGQGGPSATAGTSVTSTVVTSTTGPSTASTSSTSSSSTTTTATTTGEGGAPATSVASTSGQGGAGGQGGMGGAGGGAPTGTVLLLAGGGAGVLAGSLQAGAAWATTTLVDATIHGPALAIAGGKGVGLIRSTSNAGELRYTTWSAGAWTAFAAVAPMVTTRDTPHAVADGSSVHVAFHGAVGAGMFKHYFASYDGSTWSPADEPIGPAGNQSFGPAPAAIATSSGAPVVAFPGDDGDVYDQTRSGGAWAPAVAHMIPTAVDTTPALIEPTSGPERMIVYQAKLTKELFYTVRNGPNWTIPLAIGNALADAPPALAALPGGAAVLAFRGTNGLVYTSRFTPGEVPPWSPPAQLPGSGATPSSPALAPGVDGAEAELVYADSVSGAAFHSRLAGMGWSVPILVGGTGVTHVAVASAP